MSDQPSERPANPDADFANAVTGREGLVSQLQQLEAFVARSESEGESLPLEAVEMIARLREIVQALDGLTASMTNPGEDAGPAGRSPRDDHRD